MVKLPSAVPILAWLLPLLILVALTFAPLILLINEPSPLKKEAVVILPLALTVTALNVLAVIILAPLIFPLAPVVTKLAADTLPPALTFPPMSTLLPSVVNVETLTNKPLLSALPNTIWPAPTLVS